MASQTSQGAVSDCIQCYIMKNPDIILEQLKSELSLTFVEVCDPHHAMSLLCKTREIKNKTAYIYAERLYTSAKLHKAVVESQLVGLYY